MALSRRGIILGCSALPLLGGGALFAYVNGAFRSGERPTMTPPEALEAASRGEVLFVDIRRPDEWAATGIPEGAVPLDLRRDDFLEALAAVHQNPDQPIAVICARGVRSHRMTARLSEAGYTQVIDIPEGMLGSFAGPGWLERGLPVTMP